MNRMNDATEEIPPGIVKSFGSYEPEDEAEWYVTLCDSCTAILAAMRSKADLFGAVEGEFPGYCEYSQWKFSAESGCPICTALNTEAGEFADYLERHPKPWVYLRGDASFYDSDYIFLSFWIECDFDKGENRELFVDRSVSANQRDDSSIVYHALESSTGSQQSLDKARGWLLECLMSHEHSQKAKDLVKPLPTQLLYLGNDGSGCTIRLGEDLPDDTPYVTLSHCWGIEPEKLFKCTKSNLSALCGNVPFEKLSKTFQEAIATAISLGYSFLWIDSICIVQDDSADWQREASLMCEVYGNAVLNIAATRAKNGSEGLFSLRDSRQANRKFFRDVNYGSHQLWEVSDGSQVSRLILRSPLNQRGWVFQETYLTARTLHFSQDQVFFECRDNGHHITCEAPRETYLDCDRIFRETTSHNWTDVVVEYSKTTLTRSEDKLIALSGVARFVHQRNKSGEQYYAGLWSENLLQQLLWYIDIHTEFEHMPRKFNEQADGSVFRAPSWSWASIDRVVTWHYRRSAEHFWSKDKLQSTVHDIDVHCALVGDDPLGQISYSQMRLQCCAIFKRRLLRPHVPSNTSSGEFYFDKASDIEIGDPKEIYCLHLLKEESLVNLGRERECGPSCYVESLTVDDHELPVRGSISDTRSVYDLDPDQHSPRNSSSPEAPKTDTESGKQRYSVVWLVKTNGEIVKQEDIQSHSNTYEGDDHRPAGSEKSDHESTSSHFSTSSRDSLDGENRPEETSRDARSGSEQIFSRSYYRRERGQLGPYHQASHHGRLVYKHEMFGLFVRPSPGHGRGFFSRVGTYNLLYHGEEWDAFKASFEEQPEAMLDESIYESCCALTENGEKQYTIVLI